jgi:hypothetical protein
VADCHYNGISYDALPISDAAQSPLLRLSAVGDIAAMNDPPKRKRRWFQFSLRTLMIGVTLLAVPLGYVGLQAKIVRDRKALRDSCAGVAYFAVEDVIFTYPPTPPRKAPIPWIRECLGDEGVFSILCINDIDRNVADRLRVAFPEAEIILPADWPR